MESQGEGRSEAMPPDPDPSTPQNEFCRPGNWNGWQDREEMGVREEGPCAGQDGEYPAPDGAAALDPTGGLLYEIATEETNWDLFARGYRTLRARETFALVDATGWLLSDANPLRGLVDAGRLAAVGHSGGGHGALWAASADRRFDAAVILDQHGHLEGAVGPRVPTMFQHSDQEEVGPKRGGRGYDSLPGLADFRAFREAGVATMLVTLAGSTHQEWNYVPYLMATGAAPPCAAFCYSSSHGERVGLYYARAWLDRWLRPARRRASERRLLAREFDASVDGSSIGQGTYDPATRRNVPYRIAGRRVKEHLSRYFRSAAFFGRTDCSDLRAGC